MTRYSILSELRISEMALSDQQVSKQIEHMIQFIKNESAEKVDEIHAKVCECTTFYPCYCYGLLG